MVAHDTAQVEATHDHPNEFPSSLVQGVLVGCRPGLGRSCLEDFYVGFGDAESFGSFGREEHAIVARKNLWVTLRKQNVRARCKCVATAIALEQQQRNCYLTLSWDLGYPLNRRYKKRIVWCKVNENRRNPSNGNSSQRCRRKSKSGVPFGLHAVFVARLHCRNFLLYLQLIMYASTNHQAKYALLMLTLPSVGPIVLLVVACSMTIAIDHTSIEASRVTTLSVMELKTSGAAYGSVVVSTLSLPLSVKCRAYTNES